MHLGGFCFTDVPTINHLLKYGLITQNHQHKLQQTKLKAWKLLTTYHVAFYHFKTFTLNVGIICLYFINFQLARVGLGSSILWPPFLVFKCFVLLFCVFYTTYVCTCIITSIQTDQLSRVTRHSQSYYIYH